MGTKVKGMQTRTKLFQAEHLSLSLSVSVSQSQSLSLSLSVSQSQSLSLSFSVSVPQSQSLSLSLSVSVPQSQSLSLSFSVSQSQSLSLSLSVSVSQSQSLSLSVSQSLSLSLSEGEGIQNCCNGIFFSQMAQIWLGHDQDLCVSSIWAGDGVLGTLVTNWAQARSLSQKPSSTSQRCNELWDRNLKSLKCVPKHVWKTLL